jgi:heptose I phosphotransferase
LKSVIVLHPELKKLWQGKNILQHVFQLSGKIFRAEKNRKTLRWEANNKAYFIKLHQGVGWKEICKNILMGKWPVLGAKQEWQAIQKLKELGIPTMNLMGYGQRGGFNPATLQSFVITEELKGMVSLEDFCRPWQKQPPAPALKRALLIEVARMARLLHTHGVNHRDFYICHFLFDISSETWKNTQPQPALYLIDLHRVQIRKKTPLRWIIKDIAGLYFSTFELGFTQRDFYRFIKAYSAKSLSTALKEDNNFWYEVKKRAQALHAKEMAKTD